MPRIVHLQIYFSECSPNMLLSLSTQSDINPFSPIAILFLNTLPPVLTEKQLVQTAATFADGYVPFTTNAGVTGTLKHTAANRFLHLYQLRNGSRGLGTNFYFNNGVGNRGFLDVINSTNKTIYDFKFGNATWRTGQLEKYQRNFRGFNIQMIKP